MSRTDNNDSTVIAVFILAAVLLAGALGLAQQHGNEPETTAEDQAGAAQDDVVLQVTNVVDGDTIDVERRGQTERVRLIGIDTPEDDQCGFGDASDYLAGLVDGQLVTLTAGAEDERDGYGRMLRYVDVEGIDTGLALIEAGLAHARYDSRDGYGQHSRESVYVAADDAVGHVCD